MKSPLFSFIFILTLISLSFGAKAEFKFAPQSRLATGHWIKITTSQTGVYEISYKKLREMGFSSPEKVGVFGQGAKQQPTNFVNQSVENIYSDDISPVAVYHTDDKLFFYAQGPEEILFDSNSECFLRESRNIYSEYGYYFLSECPSDIFTFSPGQSTSSTESINIQSGFDYLYHEKDICTGVKGSGQLFLGEPFNENGHRDQTTWESRYTWSYSLPELRTDEKGKMQVQFLLQGQKGGTLSFGIEGSEDCFSDNRTMRKSDYKLEAFEPNPVSLSIPSKTGNIFVSYTSDAAYRSNTTYSHLDYWILTYSKNIPTLIEESQSRLQLPCPEKPLPLRLQLSNPKYRVFDFSPSSGPSVYTPDSEGVCILSPRSFPSEICVFDPSREQLHPLDFKEIPNQNIHGMPMANTDLLIITLPKFRVGAEKLAELHRKYDGINSLIVESPQLYNEYSSGTPDAMAYRAIAKHVYTNSSRLSNILLLGVAEANIKRDAEPGKEVESLIFYQANEESPASVASNAIDYYASFDDNTSLAVERRTLRTGIGILPCREEAELENYLAKVERFMSDTTYAYRINHILYVGGHGDSNMHIKQADEFANRLTSLTDSSYYFTPISNSYFGTPEGRSRFIKAIDQSGFAYFLGHGSPSHLDSRVNFILMKDLYLFKNLNTPFMALCGCDLTNSDRGNRGISETMVLTHPNALIATFTSFRESYASSNSTMLNQLGSALSRQLADPYQVATIGDIYKYTKNYTYSSNELTYTIVGDPALRIPAPLNKIINEGDSILPAPGQDFTLKGRITDPKGNLLDKFSGEIVGRLLGSTQKITLPPAYQTAKDTIPYKGYAPPREVLTMVAGKVENGLFSIKFKVPQEAKSHFGNGLQIALGAFSPDTRAGAGNTFDIDFDPQEDFAYQPVKDVTAPTIELLEYIPSSNAISISVADDQALNLSDSPFNPGLTLSVDGKIVPQASGFTRRLEYDRPAYTTNLFLPTLNDGLHYASVEVADAAGNSIKKSLSFIIGANVSATLQFDDEVAISEACVKIINATTDIPENTELIVTDSRGEIVTRIPCVDGEFNWNLKDANGQRVISGLYHGVARGKSAGRLFQTAEIRIPVI